jgi:aminoglycoside 6-adenylyltransferase
MRSETEMMELIVETARGDERIRAVIMNGSRANPNAPRDPFQDYDIVYFVREVAPFKNNFEWIQRFGELMILQMPEDMQDPPGEGGDCSVYLMQFMDGNRIDLGIYPCERVDELSHDSLSVLLLDKDGLVKPFDPPSEADYLPKPPNAKAFADCCNEFWWVCPYVAKGLWRGEIIYARYMLDQVVREELMKMLTWQIGMQSGFAVNPGKYGKYFQRYLQPEEWEMLLKTFAAGSYEETWQALFRMCELFRGAAKAVGGHFGYAYPEAEDARVSAHLEHVRRLPSEAREVY